MKILTNIGKKIKPLGFSGLSIYDVTIFFIKGMQKGAITTRASSLAFNFFLAFFPSIIVFFTLIPYIPIDGLQEKLLELIAIILPPLTNEITFKTLEDVISNPRGELLSVGFILALYFSTSGINSLIEAFNASYHVDEIRPLLRQRILSLALTILLSIILITTISIIVFGEASINYLINIKVLSSNAGEIILYVKWIIMLIMFLFGISILFHIAPSIKSKWKLFSPGSIFATIFIITTSLMFNYYINHFSQYNKIYGSIGTLMIILIWMYLNSIILLTGFELNASISNARRKEENIKEEL